MVTMVTITVNVGEFKAYNITCVSWLVWQRGMRDLESLA